METHLVQHSGQTVFQVKLVEPDIVYIELVHYHSGYMKALGFSMIETMMEAHPDISQFFVVFNFNTSLEPDITFTVEDSKELEVASNTVNKLFYISHDIQIASEHGMQSKMNRILTERSLLKKVYMADTVDEAFQLVTLLREEH